MLRRLVIPVCLLAIAAFLMAEHVIAAGLPVTFATIAAGDRSGIRSAIQAVVRTRAEWQTLWRRHSAVAGSEQAPPRVDFSREMVIAVFAGEVEEPVRVSILKVTPEAERVVVLFRIASALPGPEPTDMGASAPFHILRAPRSSLPVIFVRARVPDIY